VYVDLWIAYSTNGHQCRTELDPQNRFVEITLARCRLTLEHLQGPPQLVVNILVRLAFTPAVNRSLEVQRRPRGIVGVIRYVTPGCGGDEPETPSVQRFDVSRLPRVVAECLAQFEDAGTERRVADGCVGPDRAEQFVFCHDPPGLTGEGLQDGQSLRRDTDFGGATAEALDGV
jgi:hypothetical protein